MMIRFTRFNIYLLLPVLALLAGCKTADERKHDKAISSFRLFLEGNPVGGTERTDTIEIAGTELHVFNAPFLDESNLAKAAVVDTRNGGFAIQVQYDRHGTLILDRVTTENRRRRMAILTQYGTGKLENLRWLAAPYISSSITDGVLIFTPVVSRDEAEQIVLGINNVARKIQKRDNF